MESLVEEAIRQIALEGRRGCPLSHLWKLLEEALPVGKCTHLSEGLKYSIWKSLVKLRGDDFKIYIPPVMAEQLNFQSEDEEMKDVDTVSAIDDIDEEGLAPDHEIFTKATKQCRFHYLGICDAVTSRFKLSKKQLRTLEEIGRSRRKGCLQSDLARTVGISHKNFFYVIKQLEGRQLAMRNPLILDKSSKNAPASSTNILHLPQFAPHKLQQFQVFKMVADSDCEDEDEDKEASAYKLRDDASWMRQICEKITQTDNKIALEFDVKQSLGFRHTRGHRQWRRLKKKMVDLKLIKAFVASIHDRTAVCLEVLHEDFDKWLEMQRQQGRELAAKGPESCIIQERSLNLQLFQMIIEAGPQGVSTKDLFGRLRLNSKRNMHRMKTLQSLFGVEIHTETRGRTNVGRCFAPHSAFRNRLPHTATGKLLPTVPPPAGGWMMAVKRAILVTQDDPEEELSMPTYPDPTDDAQREMHAYLFSHLVSSRPRFRAQQLLEKLEADGFVLRSHLGAHFRDIEVAHGLTSIDKAPDRKTVDRVVTRLLSEDKIKKLKVSIMSKKTGEPKLVDVILHKNLEVTEGILRQIRQSSDTFYATSHQRSQMMVHSAVRRTSNRKMPVLEGVTRLSGTERRWTTQASNFQQIHANGFINAKMTRAKLLHQLICELVGLGGHRPVMASTVSSGAGFPDVMIKHARHRPFKDSEQDSKTYIFARHSGDGRKQLPVPDVGQPSVLTADCGYTFTPRQLWDTFPTDVYLKVVGTSKRSPDIAEMGNVHVRMADLVVEKQELLVDRLSRRRLSDLLDLLCRMHLIESGIAANVSGEGLLESTRFFAHDTGVIEEPTEGDSEGTPLSKRQVQCPLDTAEGFEMYWLKLEFTFSQQRHLAELCFPATMASEICALANWSGSKTLPTAKWLMLQEMMDQQEPLDWRKCRDIAQRMDVGYHQVLKQNRDRIRKRHRPIIAPKSTKRKRTHKRTSKFKRKRNKPKKSKK